MAAFAGLLTGLTGGYIFALVGFFVPILTLIIAPLYGRFVADSVLSFSGDTRGRKIEMLGVGSVLLGSFIALETPFGVSRLASRSSINELSQAVVGMALGLALVVCYYRLKQSRP